MVGGRSAEVESKIRTRLQWFAAYVRETYGHKRLSMVVPATSPQGGIRFLSEDAEGDHANLRVRGVDTDPEIMRFGGGVPPMFYFRDPDGNGLLIVERV